MQQQKYEDALPIFRKLAENNPTEYYFFERYIECFIQLKQYDEGLNVISNLNAPPNYQTQVKVLEGELYHFKGDTTRA
ncbi:MAG: tetratricopeptide repeat protein, partial [Balneola sp.]